MAGLEWCAGAVGSDSHLPRVRRAEHAGMAERRRLPVTCAPMVLFMTAFCALSVFQSLLLQELRLHQEEQTIVLEAAQQMRLALQSGADPHGARMAVSLRHGGASAARALSALRAPPLAGAPGA